MLMDVGDCYSSVFFAAVFFAPNTDAFDLYARQFAAMADRAVITFTPLVFERDDFLVLALFQQLQQSPLLQISSGLP